jgi:peptidoglycan/LPS O-acetylase OafA/YrhL
VAFALRRIGRIYLPFVAAVALSGVCCVLFLSRPLPLADWYYYSWHEPVTLAIVLKELTLSPTVTLNPSFWSLSYEIVISLLFPSFWWLLKRTRGAWSVAALVGCKLLEVWVWRRGFGSTYVGALLYYLAFFVLGVALARGRHLLSRRVEHMPRAILWSALGVSLAAYLNYILLHLQARKTDVLTAIGAAGLIILCQSPRISIGLRSRVARFFGRVSYSLYLVHGVVLLALLDMVFGRLPKWGMGVLYGGPLSLCLICSASQSRSQHTDWESAGHGRRAKHLLGDEQDGRLKKPLPDGQICGKSLGHSGRRFQ